MHLDLNNPTPSLAGGTELLVLAPLRQGLVPALDAVSYKTRTKLLLKTLHSGRKTAFEYQLFRALSDAVERVGVIHAVRVAVLEPQNQLLLSVNFDGAYESYVRVIWQKASRLLDLIFCNTEGYVLGWRSSYPAWRQWLDSVRVDTPFFYALPGHTNLDAHYLRMFEQRHRRDGDDLALTSLHVPSAERIAWDVVMTSVDPSADTVQVGGQEGLGAGIRQGLQGLVGLYRLADVYLPGTDDGQVLADAAQELLPEFAQLQTSRSTAEAIDRVAKRFPEQLAWFRQALPLPAARQTPALQAAPKLPTDRVQGGVLRQYDNVSHGLLCLVALDGPSAAAALLSRINPAVTTGTAAEAPPAPGTVVVNLAFTAEGLRACGLSETMLDWLPPEFRQGMDTRAGLLGDLRHNHPRRWALPLCNWPAALDNPSWVPPAGTPAVAPAAVHLLLQLRWVDSVDFAQRAAGPKALATQARHLLDALPGVVPLALQWLARVDDSGQIIDHFGFIDGQSQPVYDSASAGSVYANQVAPGEVLVGHDNAADHAADLPENQQAERGTLLRDGSFLVLRKLRQNVGVLRRAVDAVPLDRALVLGKMMGRWPLGHAQAGRPLVPTPATQPNDFDYSGDTGGAGCPFSAHIRLANPRVVPQVQPASAADPAGIPGARPPRIVRRSMPYGTPAPVWLKADPPPINDDDERGLVFMAYNASIAEQFEVVQRWLSGANSSGMVSAHADPFLGVAQAGRMRHFRFQHDRAVVRMPLDGSLSLADTPDSIVRLQWGFYLFAPSIAGLGWLLARAQAASASTDAPPWSAAAGAREIARLDQLAQRDGPAAAAMAWKLALEDAEAVGDWRSASVWAAIRQFHGGALRTPYGVLVASRTLVDAVLHNADGRYTVGGYQQRLAHSIGPIYLGLDDGPAYQQQSQACNGAIQALTFDEGFTHSHAAATDALDALIVDAKLLAADGEAPQWELTLDVRELIDSVLAKLCTQWFGLSTAGGFFKPGGFRWFLVDPDTGTADTTPRYPGHFTAISRDTFQPLPGDNVRQLAQAQGQAVRRAMVGFLTSQHTSITAPVTRAVLNACTTGAGANAQTDFDLAGRTAAGALMGFLPTTSGNLRRILGDWMQDGTLWDLRARHAGAPAWASAYAAMQLVHRPLLRSMQSRPVPELIWRTASRAHVLQDGSAPPCPVQAGDTVVLSLASATQQGLETGVADVLPVFGGARAAAPVGGGGGGGGAPTHACPGYNAAMGVIVGLLAAVLARQDLLRQGPAPGVLYLEGRMPAPALAQDTAKAAATAAAPTARLRALDTRLLHSTRWTLERAPQGKLLGWGDSWIFNLANGNRSLGEALAALGYDTTGFQALSEAGRTLAEMANEPVDTTKAGSVWGVIQRALVAADDTRQPTRLPLAILVSGGGNDVHQRLKLGEPKPLCAMLNDASAGQPVFNALKDSFIQTRIAGDLRTVLHNLTRVTQGRIPVLVQGYDFPIPDGRRHSLLFGPWLKPCITDQHGHDPLTAGRAIMHALITALNQQIATVVAEFAGHNVHHADLTGVLGSANYKDDWANELHPTDAGFTALATKLLTYIPV